MAYLTQEVDNPLIVRINLQKEIVVRSRYITAYWSEVLVVAFLGCCSSFVGG
jgi:hypothetical protein